MLQHAGARFITACAFLALAVSASDFVRVKPGKIECFYEVVTNPKYKTMQVEYQVTEGGDIGFELLFGDEILKQDEFKRWESHKILIKSIGAYRICFDNTFGDQQKTIYVQVKTFNEKGRRFFDD
ncbi:Protein K08E4.6 [Aphelenchoides avenae]|nr:Protein K08E4.6 [Aphelenchus avenae]